MNWLEMARYINDTYKIDIRDYAGKFKAPLISSNVPYQDFWHFVLDNYSISNGIVLPLNFEDLKDLAEQSWQKDICDMFIKEFGADHANVLFDW